MESGESVNGIEMVSEWVVRVATFPLFCGLYRVLLFCTFVCVREVEARVCVCAVSYTHLVMRDIDAVRLLRYPVCILNKISFNLISHINFYDFVTILSSVLGPWCS